jgi:hypothetical protein
MPSNLPRVRTRIRGDATVALTHRKRRLRLAEQCADPGALTVTLYNLALALTLTLALGVTLGDRHDTPRE